MLTRINSPASDRSHEATAASADVKSNTTLGARLIGFGIGWGWNLVSIFRGIFLVQGLIRHMEVFDTTVG